MLIFKHENDNLSRKKFKYYQKYIFIDITIIICDNYVIILSHTKGFRNDDTTIRYVDYRRNIRYVCTNRRRASGNSHSKDTIGKKRVRHRRGAVENHAGSVLHAFEPLGVQCFCRRKYPLSAGRKGDLIVAASGSGETPSIIAVLERLKKVGVDIFLFTASPNPIPQNVADTVLRIPAA